MKKTLVAIAALAAVGAASAQSSVTLFGVVDAAYTNIRADRTGGVTAKLSRIAQGGYNSSRLGFRGVEDLGGGMSASFWLEAGLNNDDGTGAASSSTNQRIGAFNTTSGANAGVRSGTQGLTFNRRSTVSLAGGFGEVRIGRDYVPTFWNTTVFDPFGTNGSGQVTFMTQQVALAFGVPTATRASNSVGYFLPSNLGGIYGQAMYALGENTEPVTPGAANNFQNEKDGEHIGVRLGYAAGPINFAVAYGSTKATGAINGGPGGATVAAATALTAETDAKYDVLNFGGQYDLGVAKIMAIWNQEKIKDIDLKHTTITLGALVPVGAGEIRASVTRGSADVGAANDAVKGTQVAIGYVHNLSKRTAVYTTFSRLSNSGGVAALNYSQGVTPTALGGDSRAIDFGVRHSF